MSESTTAPTGKHSEARGPAQSPRRSNPRSLPQKFGSRGRGCRGGKERDMGRGQWSKIQVDKRQRNEDEQAAKRQRIDRGEAELPIYATKFSDEVLAQEERRPKKKVAVLIGYAGTGYRGMQLTHDQKTIEGDLFKAFVAAGAISKANADDPKKSSFVRCARTDKGVHAAGNVISLKLIIEDKDIVHKINENLAPQIRVWGYERTNNSFSAYQLCDSRIYEYLIPSYAFLPPHPNSFLGRKCQEIAEEKGDLEEWHTRQDEVSTWWDKVEADVIKPILNCYDARARSIFEKALYLKGDDHGEAEGKLSQDETAPKAPNWPTLLDIETNLPPSALSQAAAVKQPGMNEASVAATEDTLVATETNEMGLPPNHVSKKLSPIAEGVKRLREAYVAAKRGYRINGKRLSRVRETLKLYCGTRNYYNYTIQKTFKDASAKRVIKSFEVDPTPILIDETEWLSLKVHGQSFMMHQIRKMVAMVALVVRCGCDPSRILESYGPHKISIPKAPSLGLLLERPVFDSYNKRAAHDLGKEAITFDKYQKEMSEFKQKEIYERMFRDEEAQNVFGNFFNHVDNFPEETFLFLTSGGIEATKGKTTESVGDIDNKVLGGLAGDDSDDEITLHGDGDEEG